MTRSICILALLTTLPPAALAADVAAPPVAHVESVQPTHTPADGTVVLSIMGIHLDDVGLVSIGTLPTEILPGRTSQILRVKIPEGLAPGVQTVECFSGWYTTPSNITITEPGTHPGPVVEHIDAARNPPRAGSELCLNGRYFVEGAHITVNGEPVSEVRFIDSERLCTTAPSSVGQEGPLEVTVINPDNLSATLPLYIDPNAYHGCACTTVTRTPGTPLSSLLGVLVLLGGLTLVRRQLSSRRMSRTRRRARSL